MDTRPVPGPGDLVRHPPAPIYPRIGGVGSFDDIHFNAMNSWQRAAARRINMRIANQQARFAQQPWFGGFVGPRQPGGGALAGLYPGMLTDGPRPIPPSVMVGGPLGPIKIPPDPPWPG